jgi:hypothetical protein
MRRFIAPAVAGAALAVIPAPATGAPSRVAVSTEVRCLDAGGSRSNSRSRTRAAVWLASHR